MRVGTSGWRYVSWRGDFYPTGLRQREELSHLSRLVTSVEVNGSFYSLQRPERYRSWAAVAPPHFEFAVKGGRYITHLRRLQGVETALANHWASGVLALGPALGPTLWQLPARSAFDEDRLDRFLSLLPRTAGEAAELAHQHDDKVAEGRAQTHLEAGVDPASPVRHALEPRHQSFDDPRARALLDSHGVALVESDSAGTWPRFAALTTDHAYVRLHGEDRLYGGGYAAKTLDAWAGRIRGWSAEGNDSYVYFDNDIDGRAPHDAVSLLDRLADIL
ncbi:DUF72 domain-containing protein [Phycicoccus sp. Root563]|uniref:DUF72 domain-containing protein n=1 Tax=Phycicoccus sp. Root563 TaxID=1736562 RepID=UPI000AA4A411|nr:DUF72 domain-containing protein [Phycicoccus sp. Root563]